MVRQVVGNADGFCKALGLHLLHLGPCLLQFLVGFGEEGRVDEVPV